MVQEHARQRLHEFLNDIKTSMSAKVDLGGFKPKSIFMGAMGGSAISANIAVGCCSNTVDVPLSVIRSPIIPNWIGKDTLAIISSYSGNTFETLEAYDKVSKTGARIIVLTSGGKLLERAKANGNAYLLIPTGFQPRYSIGYMIGYIAAIMDAIGYPEFKHRIDACIPSLEAYRNYLEAPGSLAHLLAAEYKDCIPVMCVENKFRSVSLRWKAQFNENSKMIAFDTALSEFNYCEANPWSNYKGRKMRLIVLTGEDDLAEGGAVKRAVQNIEALEFPFDLVALGGTCHEERLFRALILGDYVSVYMAELTGIDAENVFAITELKNRLANQN